MQFKFRELTKGFAVYSCCPFRAGFGFDKNFYKVVRMMLRAYGSALFLFFALSACGSLKGESPTATISGEQVLETARAIADQTRSAASPTVTRSLASPTEVQPSPSSPSPSPSPTLGAPIIRVDYNANIRRGPGEVYEVIDVIYQGDIADVIGRYDDTPIGTWWSIQRRGAGLNGWVWSGAVKLEGDPNQIPIFIPPPTSTPSPVPTSPPTPTETPTPETPSP